MIRFCENKRCTYSEVKDNDRGQIRVKLAGEERDIRNYLYRDSKEKEFKLCEICHEAIELVRLKT